ncbi:4-hydroxybenzoate octaprenyltransferase [Ruixingdingia sedimenti]|uniref:4-hydroxybenzoate octaprenyltransferase n=1 Tax=Ruixingdingia sedimenti TaxID=3073604 RepID=A0ABU1F999_9RHOB|nr:4-hydroxybenzoate octaprenyltransferase [Xinfangfangia sp. LG-4]MDR5653460.1 4-hydroxybenzoate octaprenyltransferase [Xinfangfangia sp. LG-4]
MPETGGTPEPARPGTGPGSGPGPGTVADAPRGNWVDLYAPARARPYLRLSRADRPIGTWLLLLPCWWGVALAAAGDPAGWGWWDLWVVLGCGLGAMLMRGAGCTWNDITDRDFDAAVARTRSRPLPSGQVTLRGAVAWMVAQALVAGLILLTFPQLAIMLGVGSLALVAVYPFAKRFTWWPQVFLGLAFNWGALLAYAAHDGRAGWPALLAWLGGIAWTLFYDTIYAHQDKEDDALIGVRSTARLFGDRTVAWLRGFMAVSVLLLMLAVLLAAQGVAAMVAGLAGVWIFGAHLGWQLARLDIDDPANCLWLFRSNRDAGLILALFLAVAAAL